jgi:hypothetical protein
MGTFRIKEGDLIFTWNNTEVARNRDKAGELRNRLLLVEVSGSAKPRKIQLRKPILIPPLRISDKTEMQPFQMTEPIPTDIEARFSLVRRADATTQEFQRSSQGTRVAQLPRGNLVIVASVHSQASAYGLEAKCALPESSPIGRSMNRDVTLANANERLANCKSKLDDCENKLKEAEKDTNPQDGKKKLEGERQKWKGEYDEMHKLIGTLKSVRDGQYDVEVELFFKIGDDKIILARTQSDKGTQDETGNR